MTCPRSLSWAVAELGLDEVPPVPGPQVSALCWLPRTAAQDLFPHPRSSCLGPSSAEPAFPPGNSQQWDLG